MMKIKPFLPAILMITLSVVLLLAVGLTSFLNWQKEQALLLESEKKLATLNGRKEALDRLATAGSSLANLQSLVDGVLASDPSVPIVMDQVQQIAAETGVSVIALQFSGSVSEVKVQASVSGPYASVQNFLQSVENSGRLLLVTALHFTSAGASSQNGASVTATLDITNPYFSGNVDPTTDITKLLSPEFSNLTKTLSAYKIYAPRVGTGSVGKSNPFLK